MPFDIEHISRKARVLSRKEFNELHDRWILDDCEEAYEEMIKNNLPLVNKLCYTRAAQLDGIEKDDLIQVGIMGLMTAIEKFDPDLGYYFSTYAVNWINHFINREIDNNGNTIRIPSARLKEARKYIKIMRELPYQEQNAKGIYDELKRKGELAANTSVKRISNSIGTLGQLRCLSLEMENENDSTLFDTLTTNSLMPLEHVHSHEENIIKEQNIKELFKIIFSGLNEREREIIVCRFGIDGSPKQTVTQLADKFNLTYQRILQIEKETLAKVKRKLSRIGVENLSDIL